MAVMAMTIFVLRGRKNMMGTAAVSKYQISIITSQSLASILSNFHVVSSVFITTSTVPYQLVSYRLCASLRLVAASLSSPTLVLPLANPVPPFDRASFFRVATPVSSIVSTYCHRCYKTVITVDAVAVPSPAPRYRIPTKKFHLRRPIPRLRRRPFDSETWTLKPSDFEV